MAGTRIWPRVVIGIAIALVVIVIAALLLVPLLVPVDTVRDRIVAAVKQNTGRDLVIKGGLSLSYFPVVGVTAKDVSLSNASWAAAQPMLSLEKLQVGVRLLPLVSGRVEVANFVLQSPTILLATDKQGHGNWEFTPIMTGQAPATAPAPAAQPSAQAAPGGSGVPFVSLGDVSITDGHLSYVNGVTGKTEQIDKVDVKIALPDLDSPFSLTGSAVWRDKKIDLAIDAPHPRAVLTGNGDSLKLKLDSDPVKLTFDGKGAVNGTHLAGALDLAVPSVRALAAWAANPLPAPPGPASPAPALPGKDTFGALEIKGTAQMDGPTIALSNLALSLDSLKTTGGITVNTAGARPRITGALVFDKLDVNPYLPSADGHSPTPVPAAKPSASGPSTPEHHVESPSGWSTEPLDLTALNSADLDLSITAGSILYRKYELGRTVLKLNVASGHLTADLPEMALYKGTLVGKVTVDASSPVAAIGANLTLNNVQAEPLLAAAADTSRVRGTLGATMNVTAHGKSERDLVGTLGGAGRLSLTKGSVEGIDLAALVKGGLSSATGGVIGGAGGGKTDISQAGGTFTIASGILKNNDLKMDSDLLTATGAGTVDIPNRRLDYRLEPKLASSLEVPIIVSGPWDNIGYRPELKGLVTNNLQNATKLLGNGGKDLTSPLGKALGGLLGK